MHSVPIKAASLALLLMLAASVGRAGVDVRAVSEQNGRTVVELDFHNSTTLTTQVSFFTAIAPTGTFSVKYFVGPAAVKGQQAAAAVALLDSVTASTPFDYRGLRVIWVRAQVPAFTPISHVVVDYTPAATVGNATTVDPLARELVINKVVFPTTMTTGAPDAWFSRASTWVKFSVADRGMYAVTGSDLATAGIVLDTVDPNSLRLYTHGGIDQPRAFAAPVGSWRPGEAMREVAIRVEAGTDGTFDPGDRIIFYGLGTRDWADYYDAAAPDSVFQEHRHAETNYYYLAWGASLPGAPARMADNDAAPVVGGERTTTRHREYRERDLISDFDFRGDGWLWLDIDRPGTTTYSLGTIPVSHLVSSVPQQILSVGLAAYGPHPVNHHAVFRRGGVTAGGHIWTTQPGDNYYEDGSPMRVIGNFLINGDNSMGLQVPGDLNPNDEMKFAWYAVWYERRIVASGDAVAFSVPDSTDASAVNVRARGFSSTGTLYSFDVTDAWNPARLTNFETTPDGALRAVRVGINSSGAHRHLWAGTGAGFKKPGVSRLTPVDLRAEATPPNMLIVTHRDFRASADRLRSFRAGGRLPLYTNPAVKVVTVDEVYDNFSGGMSDPMAIRNYIKYLFDNYRDANGNPRLAYVLLLGDSNEDFFNHVSAMPDFVPSNLYFTRNTLYAFCTDEWFGHLDAADQAAGHGVLDVAIGRLPAASADEASFVVDKVIAYESNAPLGDWRGRTILVADDENSSTSSCEGDWVYESEAIDDDYSPEFMDIQKIYLFEYPAIAGVKPTSRLAFLDAWNAGAMVINYIGHGSSVQMADEQVFLGSDVSQLVNGERLPILMAFSCTIGDFANPAAKSLSEKLILREGGGVIATVTASRETYPAPNERVCFAMFDYMFPGHLRGTQLPIGVALAKAKLFGQVDTFWQDFQEENSWKYNLMSDPALRPATPRDPIRFDTAPIDTLVAGVRHTLEGSVYRDGAIDTGFNGPVTVTVREPARFRRYQTNCVSEPYYLPGGPIYQGTVDAVDGKFAVSFRVPRFAATGPQGLAGAYARNESSDAATTMDSMLVVVAPTLADSLALQPVDGAPRVALGFKSGLKVVKPGDTVMAKVADGDGINILNTTNEGKQAILIDDLPVPIDVNEFFTFDHGGVDTTGTLLFPLPDLDVGNHRLVYKVSDSFGFTTLDTLRFDVTDAANFYAEAVFNYPNPFKDVTQFLFRISNRAQIKLELFTVSGKFVRRIEQTRDGGEVWVQWDGRDGSGGDVANGSYLYVATIDFVGVDRPPVVLRGALSRIR